MAVTQRTSFVLSGAQLGITVTALLVGFVAEPLIGASLGEALGGVGVPTGVGVAVGTVLALLLSTFLQMTRDDPRPAREAMRPAFRLDATTRCTPRWQRCARPVVGQAGPGVVTMTDVLRRLIPRAAA